MISAPRLLAITIFALGFAGCESYTTTHIGVPSARGHREKVEGMLQRFAKRENMLRVAQEEAGTTSRHRPFVRYRSVFVPGLTLTAFDFADSVEAQLTEHRYVFGGPSMYFDEVEQRLRNLFHSSFGSTVRVRTDAQ